jgi:hypothetical protein
VTRAGPVGVSLLRSISVRHLIVALGAVALSWLCVSVGAANLFRARDPLLAMRFAPFDGQAMAMAAERGIIAASFNPGLTADVELLARQALARDPTLVPAWRSLAAARDIQRRRADATALFLFTERLSRRDVPTQLWLIEERVAANDIPGALRHYDIALRTSSRTGSFLLPILAAATSENAVIVPLVAILRTRPAWRDDFLYELSQRAPSAPNLVAIVEGISGQGDLPPSTMALMIDRLVGQRQFDEAWRLYALARPAQARERLLRNAGFEAPDQGYAFEWRLESSANLGAQPVAVAADGTGVALAIRADSGEGGVAARQLLRLPPGLYRIAARTGSLPEVEPARMSWALACAAQPPRDLAPGETQAAGRSTPGPAVFQVPAADCAAQWLELRVRAGTETRQVGGWIDDVQIRRAQ